MLKIYSQLMTPLCETVSEDRPFYHLLTERHLQALWSEQKWMHPLKTSEGEAIKVLSPGIWNQEAGPDFLKAHVRIGQKEYRGDIEIHLLSGGWYHHRHHRDRKYNQVILHLCFWNSTYSIPINKENGQQPFCCYLSEWLMVSPEELVSLVDLDNYPSKQFANSGRCAEQLFSKLSEERIKNLFQAAAYWRLEKKLRYLEQYYPNRFLQFIGGIAMALGYRHNAKAFLDLFLYLMPYRDLPYEELLAIALGCCGFLEEQRNMSWEQSDYYQTLRCLWWGRRDQITHQTYLKLDRIRPLHHPIRRLVYLVRLLQDVNLEKLWLTVVQKWEKAIASPQPVYKKLQHDLLEVLPHYSHSYWDYHFTFENKLQPKCLPSVGKDLKIHLLLNTTLPLLYATIRESAACQKWEKFQQFFASIDMPQNSKSRYLYHRFFLDQKNDDFFHNAQMAQGAYQLHQDFCIHFEASCEGCPFVERYQAQGKI